MARLTLPSGSGLCGRRDAYLVAWLVVTTIVLASLAACDRSSFVARDEVQRVASPDGRLDAVLVEVNAGATTSYVYEVYVVPHGVPASDTKRVMARLDGATRNTSAYGATLRWQGQGDLNVEYLQARHIRDLAVDGVTVAGELVRIHLQPGIETPSAPAGGMAR
ncbi:MAG: hypothetical protein P8171_16075 [Candidatus Thiodiazotropha sp.]|jgi:hypothetical protein